MTESKSEAQYRALPHISQSRLSDFVQYNVYGERTTNFLAYKYPKPQEERFSKATQDQMLIGTIVDKALTEWEVINRTEDSLGKYTIVSKRLGKNEFELLESQADEIESLYNSINRIPEIMEVISGSEKQMIFTSDTALSLPIKGKPDLVHKPSKTVIDIKTSGKSVAEFEKEFIYRGSISQYHRYTRQLAFYRLLARENGYEIDHAQIIFAGSDAVKVYGLPMTLLDRVQDTIAFDISDLSEALNENRIVSEYSDAVPEAPVTGDF